MRRYKMCVLFLIAIIGVGQVAIAQTSTSQQYNLDGYKKDFKVGYASANGVSTIQGQVFQPTSSGSYYYGYEGVELTLDGGADFTQTVVTGTEGEFAFSDVPIGSYTIFGHNPETNAFGSVNIVLSKGQANVATGSSKVTTFNVSSLKLLFTENGLFIMNTDRNDEDVPNATPDATQMGGAAETAAMGGHFGMLGAALGAGGLAAGIAALATNDNYRGPRRPISGGTWPAH